LPAPLRPVSQTQTPDGLVDTSSNWCGILWSGVDVHRRSAARCQKSIIDSRHNKCAASLE
jgi:hypothetical protein